MGKPLVVDLFCGLGGWTRGFLAEGYDAVGFDIERHRYPLVITDRDTKGTGGTWFHNAETGRGNPNRDRNAFGDVIPNQWQQYPAQLVLQDVLTLHGRQFKGAAVIVASPPCQRYSYMAMPWKRAKAQAAEIRADETGAKLAELNALFNACFRIAREAGVPLVVENVKGAQPWVGRARANFGSFYLWGDIESVGRRIVPAHKVEFGMGLKAARRSAQKVNPDGTNHPQGSWFAVADSKNRGRGQKVPGMNFHEFEKTGQPGRSFQSAAVAHTESGTGQNPVNGVKVVIAGNGQQYGGDFGWDGSAMRTGNSHSAARKAASAQIAEIPFELAAYLARCFRP